MVQLNSDVKKGESRKSNEDKLLQIKKVKRRSHNSDGNL